MSERSELTANSGERMRERSERIRGIAAAERSEVAAMSERQRANQRYRSTPWRRGAPRRRAQAAAERSEVAA